MDTRSKKPADPRFMAPNLIFYLVNQTAKAKHLGGKLRKRRFQLGKVIFILPNSFPALCILKKTYVALFC